MRHTYHSVVRFAGLALAVSCATVVATGCILDRDGRGSGLAAAGAGGDGGGGNDGGFAGSPGGAAGMGGSEGGSGGAPAICGDHLVDPGEACDDGNALAGDGCEDCDIMNGFTCGDTPNTCVPIEQVITAGPGLGVVITDQADHYTGNLLTMDCVSLVHAGLLESRIEAVSVEVAIDHVYVGDLVLKLVSPAGSTLTLVNRPGAEEPVDAYAESPNGDSTGMTSASPIQFFDGAATDAEDMGATLTDTANICADDSICTYFASPGKGPGASFADFVGQPPAGEWRLCAADGDDVDQGTIDRVALTVRASVPPR
jgi:cysteine-rich repeat protein